MIAVFNAELLKLRRRRLAIAVAAGALVFAAITSIVVFLSAQSTGGERGATTLGTLAEAGGASEAFAVGTSFTGILVLVLFIANFSSEFSQGTFRTLLMREPRRVALMAGKLAALLAFAAVVLALTEVLTVAVSAVVAPTQDVSTAAWFTLTGLGDAASAYATSLLSVAGWASLGVALAMVIRSAPIALGVGIAWSGPYEHLVADVWTSASLWFPGLLLEALAAGGTDDVAYSRALALIAIYVTAALGAAAWGFARYDITA